VGVREHRAGQVDTVGAAAAGGDCNMDTTANWSTLPQRTARHSQSQPDHMGELVAVALLMVHAPLALDARDNDQPRRSTETFLYAIHLDCMLCAFGILLEFLPRGANVPMCFAFSCAFHINNVHGFCS